MSVSPKPRRRQKSRPVDGRRRAAPMDRCLAEYRHDFDGHVYVEQDRWGYEVWVAREECLRCGSTRVIHMVPETFEELHRDYDHPDDYDTQADRTEAKRRVFRTMLIEPMAEENAENEASQEAQA